MPALGEVPAERVGALRTAFDRTMQDPALLADAEKAQVGIEPMSGTAIATFIEDAYQTPPSVAPRQRNISGGRRDAFVAASTAIP